MALGGRQRGISSFLVKETEAHIVVFRFRGAFFLFLDFLFFGGTTSGSSATSSSGARANTGANVGDQFTDIDVLECASEKRWPERLELDIRSLEDGGDLVSGDLDVIIIEDKSGVGACQFSGIFS